MARVRGIDPLRALLLALPDGSGARVDKNHVRSEALHTVGNRIDLLEVWLRVERIDRLVQAGNAGSDVDPSAVVGVDDDALAIHPVGHVGAEQCKPLRQFQAEQLFPALAVVQRTPQAVARGRGRDRIRVLPERGVDHLFAARAGVDRDAVDAFGSAEVRRHPVERLRPAAERFVPAVQAANIDARPDSILQTRVRINAGVEAAATDGNTRPRESALAARLGWFTSRSRCGAAVAAAGHDGERQDECMQREAARLQKREMRTVQGGRLRRRRSAQHAHSTAHDALSDGAKAVRFKQPHLGNAPATRALR
jgi:hypothetical protein